MRFMGLGSLKKLLSFLGCAALLALASASAKADTVFDVSGVAQANRGQSCNQNCDFSGTLTINTTTGAVDGIDITFPGMSASTPIEFTNYVEHYSYQGGVLVAATDPVLPPQNLIFSFTTTNPGTLVGFEGGTIFGGEVNSPGLPAEYFIDSGTVTAPTPEPSSLMLLGSGMLGFAGIVRRRFR